MVYSEFDVKVGDSGQISVVLGFNYLQSLMFSKHEYIGVHPSSSVFNLCNEYIHINCLITSVGKNTKHTHMNAVSYKPSI